MAELYRAARQGEISKADLKNLVYTLSQIAKLIEIGRIERRMEILERLTRVSEPTH